MFSQANRMVSDWMFREYMRLVNKVAALRRDDEGLEFAEYAIIGGTVLAIVIPLVLKYGDKLREWWEQLVNSM